MCTTLSVTCKKLLEGGLHETTLKSIWRKAHELVHTKGMIALVPGKDSNCLDRMVANTTGSMPHLVSVMKNGACKKYVVTQWQ